MKNGQKISDENKRLLTTFNWSTTINKCDYLDIREALAQVFGQVELDSSAEDRQGHVEKLAGRTLEAVGKVRQIVASHARVGQVDHLNCWKGSFASSGHQKFVEFFFEKNHNNNNLNKWNFFKLSLSFKLF